MDTDVKVHFGSRPAGLEQRIENDSSLNIHTQRALVF